MQKLLIFITVLLTTTTVQADFLKPTWCDKAASYPEKAVCDDDGLSASAIALENRWKAYRSNHSESEISLAKIVLNDWNKDPFRSVKIRIVFALLIQKYKKILGIKKLIPLCLAGIIALRRQPRRARR